MLRKTMKQAPLPLRVNPDPTMGAMRRSVLPTQSAPTIPMRSGQQIDPKRVRGMSKTGV
jgi:hypothetical protein